MNRRAVAVGAIATCLGCGDSGGQVSSADGIGETSIGATTNQSSDDGDASSSDSGADEETGPGDGSETTGDPGTTSGGDPTGSAGCGMPSPGSGTHGGISVDVSGVQRSYDLFVPATYSPDSPASLVLNFHGLLGSPTQQAALSQFNGVADGRSMLVAYPSGIGNSFNAGACCGDANSQGIDDVGFARALVEQVSATYCVNPKRVYAMGMSNGGHMSHTLACEAADVFAAAASVTGVMGLPSCTPARPVSILDFHGTSDFVVPYGGAGPGYPAVDSMMVDWAARNGCDAGSQTSFENGSVRCETWPNCDGGVEVTLCTADGMGHCWPGDPTCLLGSGTTDAGASVMIAEMFAAQPLP